MVSSPSSCPSLSPTFLIASNSKSPRRVLRRDFHCRLKLTLYPSRTGNTPSSDIMDSYGGAPQGRGCYNCEFTDILSFVPTFVPRTILRSDLSYLHNISRRAPLGGGTRSATTLSLVSSTPVWHELILPMSGYHCESREAQCPMDEFGLQDLGFTSAMPLSGENL